MPPTPTKPYHELPAGLMVDALKVIDNESLYTIYTNIKIISWMLLLIVL